MDYSPIHSPWQGAARVAQALMGGMEGRQADSATKANAVADREMITSLSNGGMTPAAAPSTPSAGTAAPLPADKEGFVSSVMPMAAEASQKTGIDPKIIVAQAALESGYGQHAPGNNLFGIKSHGLSGGNVLPTSEVVNGQPVQTTSSFRAYGSPQESVSDYANFINTNPRYAPVKNAQGLDAQIAALGQSGYATDPQYGAKIAQIVRGMPQVPAQAGQPGANDASPLDAAQYPAGPVGAPGASAMLPPNAMPAGPAQPPQAPAQAPAADPRLRAAMVAMSSPYASDATKKIAAVILQNSLAPSYGFQTLPDGTILRTNAKEGTVAPIYQAQTKPTFGVVGESAMGGKQYGFVDPVKQKITPVTSEQTGGAAQDALSNLHGEEFLGTLEKTNAPVASQVRAIVEGRAPYPTGMLLKTPCGQTLAQYVTQADPSFESGNPAARTKMQADAATGKLGQNNNALNTAIGHLGELSETATKLNNSNWTPYNSVANYLATKKGDPAVTNFNTVRDKVAEEFTRVYRGAGGAEADVKREIENMNAANSPAQLHQAISHMAELAQSKIDANQEQYKTVMGPISKARPMVSEKTVKTLELLRTRASGLPAESAPIAAPKAPPKAGDMQDGWRFKGGDPSKRENWEQAS
jgi:flagellum-specific peptidoglycan hydrolase FlgJ